MIRLKDVCQLIVDCEHKTAPTQAKGYPSIRTPNIGRGRLLLDNVNRVSEETYRLWTQRAVPQTGDIILAREAPIGNAAIIPANLKVCLGQRTVLIRADENKVNPHYLVYLLLGDEIQGRIIGLSNGATVHHLNMEDIRNLELPQLPPIHLQEKIALILSSYDDLIENNTRRIQILEEMAQAIYREWFVHFRFPGHEGVRMVESELGMVPERWEVVRLHNLYDTGSGGTPSRNNLEFFGGDIRWLKTKELADTFILDTEEKITNVGLQNSSARIYPRNTVVIAMYGATIGKLGILSKPSSTNQACCAILPRKGSPYSHAYIYYYLLENRRKIISLGMGAAQQNISQIVIRNLELLKPEECLVEKFNAIIDPFLNQIELLLNKNQNLSQQRNLLLPRLVSGELDVEDIDIHFGERTGVF